MPLVRVYRKQLESSVVVDAIFLGKHKYEAPQVAYQPCVDAVVAFVGGHEDLWHGRNQALEAKSLQVLQQLEKNNFKLGMS